MEWNHAGDPGRGDREDCCSGGPLPEVSVIMPARDEEANIGACLASIFGNLFPGDRFEVIVVDNGSCDKTVEIAEAVGARDLSMPHGNISALRNLGVRMAGGRILAFMDADCTVAADWLLCAEAYFSREDVACFGAPPRIPEDATWVQDTWFLVRGKAGEPSETQWLESMNMFVRREPFLAVGGFNEELVTCEDVDLSYRLADHGKIIADRRIRAVHHGEARTLREFFRKERWRGRSNLRGATRHRLRLRELPSILLPLYYGLVPVIGGGYLLFHFSPPAGGLLLLLWQLPLLFIAGLKAVGKTGGKTGVARLLVLFNVYFAARFAAMF